MKRNIYFEPNGDFARYLLVENLVFILVEQERALPENGIWKRKLPRLSCWLSSGEWFYWGIEGRDSKGYGMGFGLSVRPRI